MASLYAAVLSAAAKREVGTAARADARSVILLDTSVLMHAFDPDSSLRRWERDTMTGGVAVKAQRSTQSAWSATRGYSAGNRAIPIWRTMASMRAITSLRYAIRSRAR